MLFIMNNEIVDKALTMIAVNYSKSHRRHIQMTKKITMSKEICCPACSIAGGAGMPVHHLPPACQTEMMTKEFLDWWNGRPPYIKEDQIIMLMAHQAWEEAMKQGGQE